MAFLPVGPVVKNPELTITWASAAHNLSPYLVAVDLSSSVDIIDVGTFASPSKQDVGRPQYTMMAALIWSEGLYTMLEDHIDEEGDVKFTPDTNSGPSTAGYFSFKAKYGALPLSRFAIGEKIEVDVPFAVTSNPVWTDSIE